MRYSKPTVLSCADATATIQNNTGTGAKLSIRADNANPMVFNSTTGAYEADE